MNAHDVIESYAATGGGAMMRCWRRPGRGR